MPAQPRVCVTVWPWIGTESWVGKTPARSFKKRTFVCFGRRTSTTFACWKRMS
jgi:hypothetical protein